MYDKLMTLYDFTIEEVPEGSLTTLTELSNGKQVKFFKAYSDEKPIADSVFFPTGRIPLAGQINHLNSLTDSLCENFFDEGLTREELKAKQAARRAAQKEERAELERLAAIQEEETKRIKAEEKAAAKARKQRT